jgi:hypothetical protein
MRSSRHISLTRWISAMISSSDTTGEHIRNAPLSERQYGFRCMEGDSVLIPGPSMRCAVIGRFLPTSVSEPYDTFGRRPSIFRCALARLKRAAATMALYSFIGSVMSASVVLFGVAVWNPVACVPIGKIGPELPR